jgi:beta-phosphoglucomutase family hydrolase
MELHFNAVILDLDGVVTRTAHLHAKAWAQLFDEYLARCLKGGETFKPFDVVHEYRSLLDGKSRVDGIRSFLSSRNIVESQELIQKLSGRKNELFHQLLIQEKPYVFEDAVQMIWQWRRSGLKIAIVSSSKNSFEILKISNLDKLFDVRIDGLYLEQHKLRGKPSPDLFLEAASALHVQPERAVVIEDSIVGVQAARQGRFGRVIGIAREKSQEELRQAGADQVVQSLKDISLAKITRERLAAWKLCYYFYEPTQQQLREALCTLGNGYIATRGAAEEEDAGTWHYPGTYLAGAYNRVRTEMSGLMIESDELVNWPNWLCLRFRIEKDNWAKIDHVELLHFYQELDLENGVLTRNYKARDASGRVFSLSSTRIVSMASPHLAAIQWGFTPVNWSGKMTVQSGLNGAVTNAGVARYKTLNAKHLEILDRGTLQLRDQESGLYLLAQANESHIQMLEASRVRFYQDNQPLQVNARLIANNDSIFNEIEVDAFQGKPIQVEKTSAIFSSRDHAIGSPHAAAQSALERSGGFSDLLEKHSQFWRHLWRRCDIELTHNPYEQLILRLYIFHLLQTVSTNTLDWDAGIPARGLHGEAYRGHVFWDELFVFPFFNFRIPELSRNFLRRRNDFRDRPLLGKPCCLRSGPWQVCDSRRCGT